MILRFLFISLFVISLSAKDNNPKPELNWYEKLHLKVEAGLKVGDFEGTHSTFQKSVTSFKDDLEYSDTTSSHFALNIKSDIDYLPSFGVNYSNAKQTRDVLLEEKIEIVGFDFIGNATTKIEYEVINYFAYYELKQKGGRVKFGKLRFYPGDIEYKIGIHIESIYWDFQIIDREDTTAEAKYIRAVSSIPMPHFGVKYYYYALVLYADISAISFSEAKSLNYEAGIDYRIMKDLYLSASYFYDDFEVIERLDTIKFKTIGNKFSVKYNF